MSRITVPVTAATMWPAAVLADDLYPPWFRGIPGTTYQEWSFNADPQGNEWYPDVVNNMYGMPMALGGGEWHGEYMGRQGVMQTEYTVFILIPWGSGWRQDYVQLTWYGNSPPNLNWYDPSGPSSTELLLTLDLGGGWTYQRWSLWNDCMAGCLRLDITDVTYFDQIIDDCMPEPSGGLLLSLALLLRRR